MWRISFRAQNIEPAAKTRCFETPISRLFAIFLTFFLFLPQDSFPAVKASGQASQTSSELCSAAAICDVCSWLGHSEVSSCWRQLRPLYSSRCSDFLVWILRNTSQSRTY